MPDTYWDAEKNSLKVDPAALVNDLKERDTLKAYKAAEDVRKATLPKSADEYKAEFSADFTLPPGVEYQLDSSDPVFGLMRDHAHKTGMSQDDFSKLLGFHAAVEISKEARISSARTAEREKLGATGESRIQNVIQCLNGYDSTPDKRDAKAFASMMVTAGIVEAFERLITRTTSQGAAAFTQSHRAEPDAKNIPGWDKMSFEQRRLAQDNANRSSR